MDRCCTKGLILSIGLFFLLTYVSPSMARCLLADKFRQENNSKSELLALSTCAIQYNDDESQMKLADIYINGLNGEEKDEKFALYMYQLAAETGNAEAQVRLSELLQSFDTTPERRSELKTYQKKLEKNSPDSEGFSGEIMHPYTLLLLASERSENKWYYPSSNRNAPARASSLLSAYKITPEKRQKAMQEASRWKTRKLLETAREILSTGDYSEFEKKVKNATTRTQAMTELKERLTGYIEKRQKERLAPL